MTRLTLTLACLAALAGIPASAAPASLQASSQASSVRSVPTPATLASTNGAAVDPDWAPATPVVIAPVQRGPTPGNCQNHPAPPIRSIDLAPDGQASQMALANDRHAGWAVIIRGYRATGPPIATTQTAAFNSRACLT